MAVVVEVVVLEVVLEVVVAGTFHDLRLRAL